MYSSPGDCVPPTGELTLRLQGTRCCMKCTEGASPAYPMEGYAVGMNCNNPGFSQAASQTLSSLCPCLLLPVAFALPAQAAMIAWLESVVPAAAPRFFPQHHCMH